jgi:hypothetical protein
MWSLLLQESWLLSRLREQRFKQVAMLRITRFWIKSKTGPRSWPQLELKDLVPIASSAREAVSTGKISKKPQLIQLEWLAVKFWLLKEPTNTSKTPRSWAHLAQMSKTHLKCLKVRSIVVLNNHNRQWRLSMRALLPSHDHIRGRKWTKYWTSSTLAWYQQPKIDF